MVYKDETETICLYPTGLGSPKGEMILLLLYLVLLYFTSNDSCIWLLMEFRAASSLGLVCTILHWLLLNIYSCFSVGFIPRGKISGLLGMCVIWGPFHDSQKCLLVATSCEVPHNAMSAFCSGGELLKLLFPYSIK